MTGAWSSLDMVNQPSADTADDDDDVGGGGGGGGDDDDDDDEAWRQHSDGRRWLVLYIITHSN